MDGEAVRTEEFPLTERAVASLPAGEVSARGHAFARRGRGGGGGRGQRVSCSARASHTEVGSRTEWRTSEAVELVPPIQQQQQQQQQQLRDAVPTFAKQQVVTTAPPPPPPSPPPPLVLVEGGPAAEMVVEGVESILEAAGARKKGGCVEIKLEVSTDNFFIVRYHEFGYLELTYFNNFIAA